MTISRLKSEPDYKLTGWIFAGNVRIERFSLGGIFVFRPRSEGQSFLLVRPADEGSFQLGNSAASKPLQAARALLAADRRRQEHERRRGTKSRHIHESLYQRPDGRAANDNTTKQKANCQIFIVEIGQ